MITILLATYNGEEYLKEQLESLFSQTHEFFRIIVRDDMSTDSTLEILKSYDLEIMPSNENIGAKCSFYALLDYALQNGDSNYFMFCDQDDIWNKEKIKITLQKMQEVEKGFPSKPVLIHSDLKVVDEELKIIDKSFWNYEFILPQYNSLNRLIIQNTITGCTMMINRKLAKISLPIHENYIMHDWWLGLVASKFGKINYIEEATIEYRQHGKNTIGAKGFSVNILRHIAGIFKSIIFRDNECIIHMRINIMQAKAFLDIYRDKLDQETIQMLEEFTTIESKPFWQKRKILLKYKLLKQGFIRNVGLLVKI